MRSALLKTAKRKKKKKLLNFFLAVSSGLFLSLFPICSTVTLFRNGQPGVCLRELPVRGFNKVSKLRGGLSSFTLCTLRNCSKPAEGDEQVVLPYLVGFLTSSSLSSRLIAEQWGEQVDAIAPAVLSLSLSLSRPSPPFFSCHHHSHLLSTV